NTNSSLLSLLVCPVSLSGLIYNKGQAELVSLQTRLAFPIQDGVPIMMTEAARLMSDDEVNRLRATPVQSVDNTGGK
ncbi:MAG: hypothetical protein QF420_07225, partial [Alphaproteobacteria bacterium]|nr:hypothetical protein [Alphaproteobacteria bacterium]